jgi:hypothetical protein
MQINAYKTGLLIKRVKVACTLVASDVESLRRELATFKAELQDTIAEHGAKCSLIELIIAAGLQSSRASRPAMTDFLTAEPDLQQMARKCRVTVAFLNRMGDVEGRFRIKG